MRVPAWLRRGEMGPFTLVIAVALLAGFTLFRLPLEIETTSEAPVSALGVVQPNTPPNLAGTVSVEHTVVVDGTARTYRSIVPAADPATATSRLPLLVVLSGRGEGSWTAVRTTGFLPLARQGRAVLVYPDGVGRSWNAGGGCCGVAGAHALPDTAVVEAVVTDAESVLPVDQAQVYLTGYSNGGKLAYTVACADPDRYAGVATYGAVPLAPCPAAAPLPFLLAAGGRDPILPSEGAPHARPVTGSVRTAAAWLATRDGCSGAPRPSVAGPITALSWTGCAHGGRVELAVYPASDHAWPPSMATVMWDFLTDTRRVPPTRAA